MRTLIDGYNVMHAKGLMNRDFGPDGLRQARHKFLVELAAALGPVESALTTVVFDAADPPVDRSDRQKVKGIVAIFAVGDEDADARIEAMIAAHSDPKKLTVVSSDLRIRKAAQRRKSKVLTSDVFLANLTERRHTRPAPPPPPERGASQSTAEAAHWLSVFSNVAEEPGVADSLRASDFVPTDDEIARIEREIRDER